MQRFPQYESSANKVLKALGYDVLSHQMPLCCGSTVFESVNDDYDIAPAVVLASAIGLPIVTLCGSCTQTLTRAMQRIEHSGLPGEVANRLQQAGMEYVRPVSVMHIVDVLWNSLDEIKNIIVSTRPETGVIVRPCQIFRPASVFRDSPLPVKDKMSQIVGLVGIEVVDYQGVDYCCGSTLAMVDIKAAKKAAIDKFSSIPPEAIVIDACANCRASYLRARLSDGSQAKFITEIISERLEETHG